MSGITTHVLDAVIGKPAAAIRVRLEMHDGKTWSLIKESATDADGRCKNLLPESQSLHPGTYRIHFDTALYYEENRLTGLYPWVEIVFTVTEGQPHYHIPLLLTANGYTTYRGS